MSLQINSDALTKLVHQKERVDLACAFRWTARMGMHEALANHLSLAVNRDGSKFLINPKKNLYPYTKQPFWAIIQAYISFFILFWFIAMSSYL